MGDRWAEYEPETSDNTDNLVGVTAEVARSVNRVSEDAYVETTLKLAALKVRKACNQGRHGGDPATCEDPNHRRDADYMEFCLRALGLPLEVPKVTREERAAWLAGVRQHGGRVIGALDDVEEVA